MQSINKTECPRELEPADRNTPVHVNLVKKDEEWQVCDFLKYFLLNREYSLGTSARVSE